MNTSCGIPSIELQGTEDDWKNLTTRAKKLCELMVPVVGKKWCAVLEPVLDQFVEAYKGNVNSKFWQGIAKNIPHGRGSGSYSTVSGWITVLYLELEQYHKNWEIMAENDGPRPELIPKVISSTPVTWNYNGNELFLHFHSGCFGGIYDPLTKSVACQTGWVVSHDPPKSTQEIVNLLEQELSDLKASNSTDYNTNSRIKRIETELKNMKKS